MEGAGANTLGGMMKDWWCRIALTAIVIIFVIFILWLAFMFTSAVNAAPLPDSTITFLWTNADSGQDCDSLAYPSTQPIHQFLGCDPIVYYTSGDSIFLPRHTGIKGAPDSLRVNVPRGKMGTFSLYSVNSFSKSCHYDSYLFAVPYDTLEVIPNGLLAEFWTGLFTTRVLSRVDSQIWFDWAYGSPDPVVPSDWFSSRWTGYINIPVSGFYYFYTTTNEGVHFWIDNISLVDDWGYDSTKSHAVGIELTAGLHPIKFEQNEGDGMAIAKLEWSSTNIIRQPVPATVLSH